MKNQNDKRSSTGFWIGDAALAFVALIIYICSVYKTIGLAILALSALLALYRLLSNYAKRNAIRAKHLKSALTALLCIGFAYFIIVEISIVSSARTDENPEEPYLIVLGAGVDGTVPSLSLFNRLTAALEYLETYPKTTVIVSGGQGDGEDISEAECMRRWLIENGISEDRIIKEENSFSTEENIQNSLEIMRFYSNNTTDRVAIVSSEYHLYRAKYIAREQNALPVGVAARTSNLALMINYFMREAFAVTALWIM